jgi:hypothetical protein
VPEYWIVDLKNRQLEILSLPVLKKGGEFPKHYQMRETLQLDEQATCDSVPLGPIPVGELFPNP